MSYSRAARGFRSVVSRPFVRGLCLCAVGLLLAPGLAQADAPSYTWLEGGYQRLVPGRYLNVSGTDSHGEFLTGSYALTDQFDLHGDFYDQKTDSSTECSTQVLLGPPPVYVINCYNDTFKSHGYRLGLG